VTQTFRFRMATVPLVVGPLLIVLGVAARVSGTTIAGVLLTIVGLAQMSPALVIAPDHIAHRPAPLGPRHLIAITDITDVTDGDNVILLATSSATKPHRIRLTQFAPADRPRVRSQLLSLRPST